MLFHVVVSAALAVSVPLVTFDGVPGTGAHTFHELNDPVMGGRSTGTWSVVTSGQFGVMNGSVVDVPKLSAPGFITAETDASGKAPFADVSSALAGDLVLTVRSTTPDYTGFRVSFAAGATVPPYACAGGGSIPFSRGCFKANFTVPAGTDQWHDVRVPFASFSDLWSPATGKQTTTCADDPSVCPTAKGLAKIQRMQVWAEGVLGDVHLEVKAIRAATASASAPAAAELRGRPPSAFDTCSAAVQPNLRFNISSRTEPEVPVSVDPDESLATAVCCDSRAAPFAEPQFLFLAPDIALFSKLPATGATTFHDSVCGVPLFTAPVGRSLADFQADSQAHGWPSFREGEVSAHVIVNKTTGVVKSSCGTHLGTYLPDDKGARYCIDLSCISGNAK
jgi:hypothetical protein